MKNELLINFIVKVEDLGNRAALEVLSRIRHQPNQALEMAVDRIIELRNMIADLKRDVATVENQEAIWKAQAGVLDMTMAAMAKKERV